MNRREFIKAGTLAFSLTAVGDWTFDWSPDSDHGNTYNNCIPFRKEPRHIREEVKGFLWADAADFHSYGGWALDTQHVGFMGSSYLLAHGTSGTVGDATLKLKNIEAGKYRLWVRSRNWIPAHAPGTFGVLVNGNESGLYGAQKEKGWTWQNGGEHDLRGEVTITLRDKTGLFGRCSSIILTRDLDYKPPVEITSFCKERARLSGVSDSIQNGKSYDVIVVGAGPAGAPAAIAAARLGARVALVSNRPILGGNASAEIGVPVQGAGAKHRGKPVRETGIIEEAGRIAVAWNKTSNMSRAFQTLVDAEPQIDVYPNFWLENVEKKGAKIQKAILRDTLTGSRKALTGKMFIDCTGDGWLGHHAGADQRVGREARSEYNEMDAPLKADSITMSGTLRGSSAKGLTNFFIQTEKYTKPQPFKAPPWVFTFPKGWENDRNPSGDRLFKVALRGSWWLEHPGDVDDLWDPEFARDELIRVCFSFWNHMKNRWTERGRLANYKLAYIPFMVGKRESRRLMGDYVMNANDALKGTKFNDVIAHTGWTLDVHHPKGILSTEGPNGPNRKIPIGQIPYRCLYSRNIENLFMAGRCSSVTHEALGTVRIEASCAVTGQAVGAAAALALHRTTTPRGIYQKHLGELQQLLLRHDQFVPGVSNQDPADLALQAKVTASSTRPAGAAGNPNRSRWFNLGPARGECFEWPAGTELRSVSLRLRAKTPQQVTLHLRSAKNIKDLSAGTDIKVVTRKVPPGDGSWVEFDLGLKTKQPHTWIWLDPNPAVDWCSGDGHPKRFRFYGSATKWTTVPNSNMSLRLDPQQAAGKTRQLQRFSPDNVVNGIARPWIDGESNTWESDPKEKLPQWIELTLKQPAEISVIHCVFDTDLTVSLPTQRRDPTPAKCVRSYTLECRVDGSWKTVASVRQNIQRFRRHRFSKVKADKVRLTVHATHGIKSARVMEIRIYTDEQMLLNSK